MVKHPKNSLIAMICATILQIINMYTVQYDNATYIMVMIALLGLAGWETKKK